MGFILEFSDKITRCFFSTITLFKTLSYTLLFIGMRASNNFKIYSYSLTLSLFILASLLHYNGPQRSHLPFADLFVLETFNREFFLLISLDLS